MTSTDSVRPFAVAVDGMPTFRFGTREDAERCAGTWEALGESPAVTADFRRAFCPRTDGQHEPWCGGLRMDAPAY